MDMKERETERERVKKCLLGLMGRVERVSNRERRNGDVKKKQEVGLLFVMNLIKKQTCLR